MCVDESNNLWRTRFAYDPAGRVQRPDPPRRDAFMFEVYTAGGWVPLGDATGPAEVLRLLQDRAGVRFPSQGPWGRFQVFRGVERPGSMDDLRRRWWNDAHGNVLQQQQQQQQQPPPQEPPPQPQQQQPPPSSVLAPTIPIYPVLLNWEQNQP